MNAPGSKTEMEPLHTEYPAKGKVSLSHASRGSSQRPTFLVGGFLRSLARYISLLCSVYPTPCAILMFAMIALALFGIGEVIFNPRVKYGDVHDHSNIKSVYDFQIANVDHWCLKGDSESCLCEDPLQPISRAEHNSWKYAFKANRKIVRALEDDPAADVDIVFLGESVVEEMDGRWMGMEKGGNLAKLKAIFDKHFNKQKGGQLNGVALGIAGDTAPNVLFRLLHGEISAQVQPKVYWLSMGMNDLARMQCSEEIVVLGILRVVEELLKRTDSYIVINSLFPMFQMRGSAYPILSDANEAFQSKASKTRGAARTANTRFQAPGQRFLQGPKTYAGRPQVHSLTDEELKAIALKEEEARDEELHERIRERIQLFHSRNNPALVDKHHIRKHTSARKLPLWTSIAAINRQLSLYARNNPDRIHFFDATRIFTEREGKDFHLRLDRITPKGHPTFEGYTVWEDAVANRAIALVQKWIEEHPDAMDDDDEVDEDDDEHSKENDDDEDQDDDEELFDIDKLINDIDHSKNDDMADEEFKNFDDQWLDRLGEDDEFQDDDDEVSGSQDEGNVEMNDGKEENEKIDNAGTDDDENGGEEKTEDHDSEDDDDSEGDDDE